MFDDPIPALETGFESTTPVGDTFLRRFLLNCAEFNESISVSAGGGSIRDRDFWASDSGKPSGFSNAAILMRPLPPDPSSVLLKIDAFFAERDAVGAREVLVFTPWAGSDLSPFGWNLAGHPPVHLLPRGATPAPVPAGFRIVSVDAADLLARFEQVVIDGYPFEVSDSSVASSLFPVDMLQDSHAHFFLGFEYERAVSASLAYVLHGINCVSLVATLPGDRGKGYGEAMTWQASLVDPTLPAMLLSSDPGRPIYERMGYLPLLRFTLWYRNRP